MTTPFKKGDLVIHSKHPEWGPGKVALVLPAYIFVFFRNQAGRRASKFPLPAVQLELAASQSDAILDNLPPFEQVGADVVFGAERLAPKETVALFLERFPDGFKDPAYVGSERDYKWKAHVLCQQLLSPVEIRRLLAEDDVPQLVQRVSKVVSSQNLLSRFESAALHGALALPEAAGRFLTALAELTDAPDDQTILQRYLQACAALPQTGATKPFQWPVVTLLPFLARPDVQLCLKPEVTKVAAGRLGFDLKYQATPNLETYRALLRLGSTWFHVIEMLQPKDMIDVQSFIYVTGGGYDTKN